MIVKSWWLKLWYENFSSWKHSWSYHTRSCGGVSCYIVVSKALRDFYSLPTKGNSHRPHKCYQDRQERVIRKENGEITMPLYNLRSIAVSTLRCVAISFVNVDCRAVGHWPRVYCKTQLLDLKTIPRFSMAKDLTLLSDFVDSIQVVGERRFHLLDQDNHFHVPHPNLIQAMVRAIFITFSTFTVAEAPCCVYSGTLCFYHTNSFPKKTLRFILRKFIVFSFSWELSLQCNVVNYLCQHNHTGVRNVGQVRSACRCTSWMQCH